MKTKRLFPAVLALSIIINPFILPKALACGHEGFYLGLGYEQLLMYTPEDRLTVGNLGNVTFGPGYGGTALIGYDFCGTRWGVQMPFEFSRLKLNRSEWVNQFGSSAEGIFHIAQWRNGFNVHLVGGVGWSYITEGDLPGGTAAAGVTASFGPGVSFFFTQTNKISGALNLEVPIRMINYFGSHLSQGGTTILAIPMRLTVQLGF